MIELAGFDSLESFVSIYISLIEINTAEKSAVIITVHRKVKTCEDSHIFKEDPSSYNASFDTQNDALRGENTLLLLQNTYWQGFLVGPTSNGLPINS